MEKRIRINMKVFAFVFLFQSSTKCKQQGKGKEKERDRNEIENRGKKILLTLRYYFPNIFYLFFAISGIGAKITKHKIENQLTKDFSFPCLLLSPIDYFPLSTTLPTSTSTFSFPTLP
jgi:hypothetical protein